MMNGLRRSALALGALAPIAATLGAQALTVTRRTPCAPGLALGVTAYQCSNCSSWYFPDSGRTVYTFGAELVVLNVQPGSQLRAGDVIVAVNGNPITTRAGADQFTYPALRGVTMLTVRRNGANIEVGPIIVTEISCLVNSVYSLSVDRLRANLDSVRLRIGAGVAAGGGGGGAGGRAVASVTTGARGGAYLNPATAVASDSALQARYASCTKQRDATPPGNTRTDSLHALLQYMTCVLRDSTPPEVRLLRRDVLPVIQDPGLARGGVAGGRGGGLTLAGAVAAMERSSSLVELRNFGLSVRCASPCTRARATDGTAYWRFDGYPLITNPVKDGVADKAGVRDGDVLVAVNGVSPLTEEGALLIARYDRGLTLKLEVSRAGKRQKFTLKL